MHRDNRPGVLGDQAFHAFWGHAQRLRIDVGKNWQAIDEKDRRGGGDKGDRGDNYLIAEANPGSSQGAFQGDGAIHAGHAVFGIVEGGKFLAELIGDKTRVAFVVPTPSATLQHGFEGFEIGRVIDRPGWIRGGADGRPAQKS